MIQSPRCFIPSRFTELPKEVTTQLVQFKRNSVKGGCIILKALYLLFPEENGLQFKWIIT